MKNTKRITNINDYSKEVDKIIASGKPVHEQLMEMLEMVGGKFVDVSSNKHDKSVQDFRLSDCCGAKVLVTSAIPDEGTRYWKCSECGKPCNIMDKGGRRINKLIRNDITTAKVHPKKKSSKTNTDDYWEALSKGEE